MDNQLHKKKTISGLRWTLLDQITSQLVTFGLGILLMTLLTPASFGLLGMVTVFSGFLSVFKDFGLGSSLIQKKNINEKDVSTVYWASVFLGTFLTVLLISLAPLISNYFKEPKLTNITIVLSFVFLIQSFSITQQSLLKKKLEFKKIFKIRFISTISAGLVSLLLAYLNWGVWALVFQKLIDIFLITTLTFIFFKSYPKIAFSKQILKSHLNFSLPLVGRQSINYWARNADNFLIGKFFGAELLGIYTRSYSIMMLPVSRISGVISSVLFPSLSLIQDDKERVNTIFLKTTRTIAFVTFPLMAILTLGSESFVKLLFSEEWFKMIPVLQILASVGAIHSVSTLNGNMFLLKAQTKLDFKLTVFNSIVYILGFIISSHYNLITFSYIYLFASVFLLFVNWIFLSKIIDIKFQTVFYNIFPHIILYLFTICTGYYLLKIFFLKYELVKVLFIIVFTFCLWTLIFFIFKKKELKELLNSFNLFLRR